MATIPDGPAPETLNEVEEEQEFFKRYWTPQRIRENFSPKQTIIINTLVALLNGTGDTTLFRNHGRGVCFKALSKKMAQETHVLAFKKLVQLTKEGWEKEQKKTPSLK